MLDGRKKAILLVTVCIAAVLVIGLLGSGGATSMKKEAVVVDDLTPLAGLIMSDPNMDFDNSIFAKLDGFDSSNDCGEIQIRFKNVDTKEKYILSFNASENYQVDISGTVPEGTYKLKILEKGDLDSLKLKESKVSVSSGDNIVLIKFK